MKVVDFLNGIPNLDYAVVEESIRQQEIDGQALLLLTQVHTKLRLVYRKRYLFVGVL